MKKTSKIISVFLVVIICITSIPLSSVMGVLGANFIKVSAANSATPNRYIPDGYVGIYSVSDLFNIKDGNGSYMLMQDIDMSGYIWQPKLLSGTFDGNGYSIKNLYITTNYNKHNPYGDYDGCGFFGSSGGTLKNLTLENITIHAPNDAKNIGGLVGQSREDSTIENCHVSGVIYASEGSCVGGLAGTSVMKYHGTSTLRYNSSDITIFCESNCTAGGLVGKVNYRGYSRGVLRINDSFSVCSIYDAENAGGLFGYFRATDSYLNGYFAPIVRSTLKNCYSIHKLYNCENIDAISPYMDQSETQIENLYYNSSVDNDKYNNSYGVYLSDLTDESKFVGFDFENIWGITNGKYPTIRKNKIRESQADYFVKIIDSVTNEEIDGATISIGSKTYISSLSGGVKISASEMKEILSSGKGSEKVIVTKGTHETAITDTRALTRGGVTVVKMKSLVEAFGISEMIAGLAIDSSQTIAGPSINLFGEEYPLFSMNGGLKLGNNIKLSVKQNTNNKTLKVMGGLETKGLDLSTDTMTDPNDLSKEEREKLKEKNSWDYWYNQIENFYGLENASQKAVYYEALKNRLEKEEGKFGVKCTIEYALFMEFDYSSGSLIFNEGGLVVTISAAASATSSISATPPLYLKFKIAGELEGKLKLVVEDMGYINISGSLEGAFKPSIGVGLGNDKIASIEAGMDGSISAGIDFPFESIDESFEMALAAQIYLRVQVWRFDKKWSTNWPKYIILPWSRHGLEYTTYARMMNTTGTVASGIDKSDLQIMSRDYLHEPKVSLMRSMPNGIDENSVYPYGNPKLAKLNNDNIVAVWVYDDGTKAESANCTTLYYSIYNGSSWSQPTAVYESGRADMDVSLCTDGEKVYALWQRGSETMSDDISIDDALTKTELVFSTFDGADWAEPIIVDEAGSYQVLYNIATNKNGEIAFVWGENDKSTFTLSSGTTTIYKKMLVDDTLSEASIIETIKGISSLAVGYIDDSFSCVYSVDADGDFTTNNDSEIYVNGVVLTKDEIDDVTVTYQNGTFYWLKDNDLFMYSGGTAKPIGVTAESDYVITLFGNQTAVVYTANDGFKNELVMHTVGKEEFVNLTNYGKHISSFDLEILPDGRIISLMDIDNLSEDTSGEPYTTTDMKAEIFDSIVDLEITEDVIFEMADIAPNSYVTFKISLKNRSLSDVNSYSVRLIDNETVLSCINYTNIIPSGETKEIEFTYLFPEKVAKQNLIFEVVTDNDVNIKNNSTEFTCGYSDISIQDYKISDNGKISATIINKGYESAKNIIVRTSKFINELEELDNVVIDTLAPGETYCYEYVVNNEYVLIQDETTINHFVLSASTDTEEAYVSNNTADLWLNAVRVEKVTVSEDYQELNIGEAVKLSVEVFPSNSLNKKVHWLTSDEKIAVVDNSGNVTAIGSGLAKISAISDDGAVSASCSIRVKEVYHTISYYSDGELYAQYSIAEGHQIFVPKQPIKKGYAFLGWLGDTSEYMGNEDMDLEANWLIRNFDAVFDANGGMYSDGSTSITIPTEYNCLPVPPDNPKQNGKVFIGWSPELEVMPDKSVVYTAQWADLVESTYKVNTYLMGLNGEYTLEHSDMIKATSYDWIDLSVEELEGFTIDYDNSILSGIVSEDNSLTLEVYYIRNTYNVTFKVGSEIVAVIPYMYQQQVVSEPTVPEKQCFIGKWESYELAATDIVVEAEYTLNHKYESKTILPTCISDGYTMYNCSVCGDYYKADEVAALGHSWDEGVITTEPTMESEGVMTYTCSVCGATKTEVIEKLQPAFTESEDAVITEDGNICANIGKTAESLLAQASDGATLVDKNGNALSADSKVGTGAVLTLADGTQYEIFVPGDVDGDGNISASDARLALRASVGLETYDEASVQYKAAKVESADTISASDARLILRASVGLDDPNEWFEKIYNNI